MNKLQFTIFFDKYLQKNKKVTLPKIARNVSHAFHLFVIRIDFRSKLIKEFVKNKIEYGIHYPKALHKLKAYKKHLSLIHI